MHTKPTPAQPHIGIEQKVEVKKLMTACKNNETGLVCRTSPLNNLSEQGYANVLRNQRLSKTDSPRILGGRVNQTNVSNTNNIFTPPSTPVNLEEDQHENDFVRALKQQQKQQQRILPRQQAFSIHKITSVEKEQLMI